MPEAQSRRVWDASECVLMLIDYQDHVLDVIFAQDRRLIELNVRTLAKMAVAFKIPVILSTVGVEMGANGPTIESLQSLLPHVKDIDRSTMNAWGDPTFVVCDAIYSCHGMLWSSPLYHGTISGRSRTRLTGCSYSAIVSPRISPTR